MHHRRRARLLLSLALALACRAGWAGSLAQAPRLERGYGQLPLYFVEDPGNGNAPPSYHVLGQDTGVVLTSTGVAFVLRSRAAEPEQPPPDVRLAALRAGARDFPKRARRWTVALDFIGTRRDARPVGEGQTSAVVSYFQGPREQWRPGVATYARVVYRDLWPGIDLTCDGTAGKMKYTFVVRPGADPGRIRLAYRGAESVRLTGAGQIEVTTPVGGFVDDRPIAYQEVDGRRVVVPASYAPKGKPGRSGLGFGFRVGAYDRRLPLVIDPVVLVYCGFIGGSARDGAAAIAVDRAGSAYVTGSTDSGATTFPVTVGPDLLAGGRGDAFVAKLNPAGTGLEYCGYIGGSSDDRANAIAVDGAGSAYVTGETYSTEATFPVTVGPDLQSNGGGDAFVARLNPTGTGLDYCGYIGGSSDDNGNGIAVDGAGNAYVTGNTRSGATTFPVVVGPGLTLGGSNEIGDAFVAKVTPDGAALSYCGYIGGAVGSGGFAIAVDGTGHAYVTGSTLSTEATFPVSVGPDLTSNGDADAFVAKVSPAGTGLEYCGYIGGSGSEGGYGVAVDGAGNAYVAGSTSSTETTFPVSVGPDLTANGDADAFVAKVSPAGTGLEYCGYIGGSRDDNARGIAVDGTGNAYATGPTWSRETTFPVRAGPGLTFRGGYDAFVAKVSPAGTELAYCGYIGGSGADTGSGVAVDGVGSAYVTGATASTESTFPVTVGPDLTYNGEAFDAFVAKVSEVSCAAAAAPVARLLLSRPPASRDDIRLEWQFDPAAAGYNVWYVTRKQDVPFARQANPLIAIPVDRCAAPFPASGTTCTDPGAVSRGPEPRFFYQVRAYCDAFTEGP